MDCVHDAYINPYPWEPRLRCFCPIWDWLTKKKDFYNEKKNGKQGGGVSQDMGWLKWEQHISLFSHKFRRFLVLSPAMQSLAETARGMNTQSRYFYLYGQNRNGSRESSCVPKSPKTEHRIETFPFVKKLTGGELDKSWSLSADLQLPSLFTGSDQSRRGHRAVNRFIMIGAGPGLPSFRISIPLECKLRKNKRGNLLLTTLPSASPSAFAALYETNSNLVFSLMLRIFCSINGGIKVVAPCLL